MLRSTERFLVGLMTIGMILLITVQLMMQSSEPRSYIQELESKIRNLTGTEVQEVAMLNSDGFVTLKLITKGHYPQARVLVNNDQAYYFDKGPVKIPVNSTDMLIFDTRGIKTDLWFKVLDFSTGITNVRSGQEFHVYDGCAVFPIQMEKTKF